MHATWLNRAMRSLMIGTFASAALVVSVAHARPAPGQPSRPRARNLFAGSSLELRGNRVQCFLNDDGQTCSAASSPVGGGGFWPIGTVDQYIFNTGLQLAGIVDPSSAFAWAGDTTGAFLFDARGDQLSGDPLTPIYNSLDAGDLSQWPNGAIVRNAAIFNPVLLNRPFVSQQDSWVRYWEGDPSFLGGRSHPMGIVVEQRSLAWNYPTGNEHIIYFLFTFYNVTARASSGAYNNPTIPPEVQAEIAAAGDQFQSLNEARFGVPIPDGGYAITDMYAAFAADMDVADFEVNYSTAVLPFNLGLSYAGDFLPGPGWTFPPDIFGAPFAAAVGFVGVKYLRSPESSPGNFVGLTMFSATTNGLPFPDPRGVNQLYRYLSGFVGPADQSCSFTNPAEARARRLCYQPTQPRDARFYQASGPFVLPPGESRTIVVAYVHGAPLAAPLAALPGGGLGGDNPPGIPWGGDSIAVNANAVRPIDRVMGWVSHSDLDGDGVIEERGDLGFEIETAPRSLLSNALVAQAVYESGFLLPFSPEAPSFYLVPGDNQVTVVWQRSATEDNGDPYFDIASDPNSPLYDPNFRQFDVEGYRIYRGRTSGSLELIAQLDYAGTALVDYTGGFDYGAQCAPELGITTDCPTFPVEHDLSGVVVQVPPGGRVELAGGDALILQADTAVIGGAQCTGPTGPVRCPELQNTGVPFVYVDRGVRNSFQYFYVVTAFDVNSVASGPTSLESARVTKRVTPRRPSSTVATPAGPVTFALVDRNGAPLTGAAPTINATTGTFSGPAAPTAALAPLDIAVFADQLIQPNAQAFIRVDSVVPSWYHSATYFLSLLHTDTTALPFGPAGPLGEEDGATLFGPAVVTAGADTVLAKSLGLGAVPLSVQGSAQVVLSAVTFTSKDADWHPDVDGAFFEATGITDVGGSRWFDGANETLADPTLGLAHGALTNVTAIYRPVRVRNASNLFRRWDQTTYHVFRAADIRIYWGATPGTVDSVVDVTHNVTVPFDGQYRASYGFISDFSGANDAALSAPNGVLTYNDILFGGCLAGAAGVDNVAGCDDRDLAPSATLQPVDVTGDQVTDGDGFGLYINGEAFVFQMAALPSSTVWTYRSYMGAVGGTSGSYTFTPKSSNAPIPGLRLRMQTTTPAMVNPAAEADLARVHTVPDPYYVSNALEVTSNAKVLRFVGLPTRAIVRIYSVSGVLVAVVPHDDPTGGGETTWDLRNRNNQFVASGVYFYHVETPSGQTKMGRFTVVNFAP